MVNVLAVERHFELSVIGGVLGAVRRSVFPKAAMLCPNLLQAAFTDLRLKSRGEPSGSRNPAMSCG
jgi:hypothetical protein